MPDPAVTEPNTPDGRPARWAFRFLLGTCFSIAFSIVLGEVCLLLSLTAATAALIPRRRRPSWPGIAWFALAFCMLAVITGLAGVNRSRSLGEFHSLLWLLAIPLGATLVQARGARGQDHAEHGPVQQLLRAFTLGGGVLALQVCVMNPIEAWRVVHGANPYTTDYLKALIHRGSMTDGQMLMLGMLVSTALVFGAGQRRKAGWGWFALLLLQGLALLVNFKRGSWLCTGACLTVLIGLRFGRRGMVAVVAAFLVLAFLPPVRARLMYWRKDLDPAPGGRIVMWLTVTPHLVRAHPFGIGYGALSNERMREIAPNVEKDRDHLHSNIFQILVETGWLGLMLYLAWVGRALCDARRFARISRFVPAVSLVPAFITLGLFLNGLVEYNFGDSELLILWAILTGATAGAAAPQPKREIEELRTREVPTEHAE